MAPAVFPLPRTREQHAGKQEKAPTRLVGRLLASAKADLQTLHRIHWDVIISQPIPMALRGAASDPFQSQPASLIPGSPYSVVVLQEGYTRTLPDGTTQADGTVSLVRGPRLTVVDTGGPWGRERLLTGLAKHGVAPSDVQCVVCTHGHSDHVGNLNLFPCADLIVGTDLCKPDGHYLPTGLRCGASHPLHAGYLEVLPTPGHTGHDVSLLVRGTDLGDVLVAGDLFEHNGDDGIWQLVSEDPTRQAESRARALGIADLIVPGHGAPFRAFSEKQEQESGRNVCSRAADAH